MDRFTTPYYLCHHPVNLLQVTKFAKAFFFRKKAVDRFFFSGRMMGISRKRGKRMA
ncbi:MAG: hypothetical protein AB2L14_31335 [Candidatus Xenobiia bacterium LiM19]